MTADGGLPLANNLKYDIIEPSLKRSLSVFHTSWLKRSLMSAYCNTVSARYYCRY
ncbi:unnamed protein product [Trichobilharzia regenti]|nr:unnamed protein product [Trichobilharzia regenti]